MKIKPKKIEVGDVFTVSKRAVCTVVKYVNAHNVYVKFNDEHGHVAQTRTSDLRRGKVKNPFHPSVYGHGFPGVGPHRTRYDGKLSSAATAWINMLRRCYHEDPQNITYVDCFVNYDWLNFQNFADWYGSQDIPEGWQLDKDWLFIGNREYSADLCRFVPREVNTAVNDSLRARGNLPLGVEISGKNYSARLKNGSERVYLGTFKNVEDAFAAYKESKETYLKYLADKYADCLCPRVLKSLRTYQVKPFN